MGGWEVPATTAVSRGSISHARSRTAARPALPSTASTSSMVRPFLSTSTPMSTSAIGTVPRMS